MATRMQRRSFLTKTAAVAVGLCCRCSRASARAGDDPLVGIQIAPFNIFDEGIETCLDRVKELAAVNTLFIYSHTYYGIPYTRTANILADDHGVTPRDDQSRIFWPAWVKHHERYYRETSLRFADPDPDTEYAGRDVFHEIAEPARQRGLRVYARLLEPGHLEVRNRIHNYHLINSINLFGRPGNEPCRNHPEYKAWCQAMVTDLMKSYELSGYQWGAERIGPLAGLLSKGEVPTCFCSHCEKVARDEGVDSRRARVGFTRMHEVLSAVRNKGQAPDDGLMNHLLALMLQYPEMLSWEHMWRQAKEGIARLIYRTIKTIHGDIQVGRHIDSKGTTLNPITRAGTDYAAMAEYSDFIKPILYQDVMAPRIADHYLGEWTKGAFRELDPQVALRLLYSFNGYTSGTMPTTSELRRESLPPSYVAEETERLQRLTSGKTAIYPGIGLDVPHREGESFRRAAQRPEDLRETVLACLEAGADGVVASREYDEMRLPTLRAFGDAIREGQWRSSRKVE